MDNCVNLLCDLRERNSTLPLFPIKDFIIKKTLEVGDYAIINGDLTYFVFERKTWSDLAGSLKDGRLESQMKNMMQLECGKMIIIEGKMTYKRDFLINGIEFYKLDAYRRKLLIDGMQVVQTRDPQHTVDFLVDFTEQVAREKIKKTGAVKEIIERKQITMEDQVDLIWRAFPGIGNTLLPVIRKYSIYDVLDMAAEDLAKIKYLSGRSIGVKAAQKILSVNTDQKAAAKVLSAIYGISVKAADFALQKTSFMDFIKCKGIIYLSEKKTLGNKMQEKILALFSFRSL